MRLEFVRFIIYEDGVDLMEECFEGVVIGDGV